MTRPKSLAAFLPLFSLLLPAACVSAPPVSYPDTAPVVAKRQGLRQALAHMLPAGQQSDPAALQEAAWLADTAYKAAAAVARVNKPALAGWLNNRLVNSGFHFKERGLCWHYQHDMYRELRRRPLQFFRIGCCVRDRATGSEHNCIYLCPAGNAWPHVIILDAWRYHGRLKVMDERDFAGDDWADAPHSLRFLSIVYPERHRYPMEHWAKVRSDESWKVYIPCWTPAGTSSRQGILMQHNIYNGLKARNGRLTDY